MRAGRDVCWIEEDDDFEPLVTVAIPTYARAEPLMAAVESALGQTYEHLEVLVIGDNTDEQSVSLIGSCQDPRVRFVNLPQQGIYPSDPRVRGLVSGTKPMNVALDLAAGAWLATCDDDDELMPDHVAHLLSAAKRRRLEFVYGQFQEIDHAPSSLGADVPPRVTISGSEPIRFGAVARGAALYSMGLSFMRYDSDCWRIGDPHDWNLYKRMQLIGVRIGFEHGAAYKYNRYPIESERSPGWWSPLPAE